MNNMNPNNASKPESNRIGIQSLWPQIETTLTTGLRRYRRLWTYYDNPMLPRIRVRDEQGSDRPYRQGQEWGLPSRLTGVERNDDVSIHACSELPGVARKEVVVENDIGWRIDVMVDFLVGKELSFTSLCSDPNKRRKIESILDSVIHQHGGAVFFQHVALLAAVYGFVDLLVKLDADALKTFRNDPSRDGSTRTSLKGSAGEDASLTPAGASAADDNLSSGPGAGDHDPLDADLARIARLIRVEIVEPSRALPVLSESNWQEVSAYAQVYTIAKPQSQSKPAEHRESRIKRWFSENVLKAIQSEPVMDEDKTVVTEVLSADRWERYHDQKLIDSGRNSLGRIPLVHIQNIAKPFQYAGTSEVEQLIGLQDELNTRLSDRAARILMQSFKMYLAKGLDDLTETQIAPGRMWITDNTNADIVEFGGDASNPSEDQHIADLREAMDKVSGVTPIAAGAIRGRVGNLTSAAALRVTMIALLAKTERKRTVYGQASEQLCELILAWLDCAGVLKTSPDERKITIHWQGMMPDAELDRLREAQTKSGLGVSHETILKELGYAAEQENQTTSTSTDSPSEEKGGSND